MSGDKFAVHEHSFTVSTCVEHTSQRTSCTAWPSETKWQRTGSWESDEYCYDFGISSLNFRIDWRLTSVIYVYIYFVTFKTLCCLSKLKPTPLRPMACPYCSPSYRNLRWVSVYTWDVVPSDRPIMAVPIFRSSDPRFPANFAALVVGMHSYSIVYLVYETVKIWLDMSRLLQNFSFSVCATNNPN